MQFMNYKLVPSALTTYRLILGPIAVLCAMRKIDARLLYAFILVTGILSDIFDGIIARRMGVATATLRRYDSAVDLFYYSFVLLTAYILRTETIISSIIPLFFIISSELICVLLSLAKFKKLPATHTYMAKLYGIVIFLAFFLIIVANYGPTTMSIAAFFAVIANLEICLIMLKSKESPVDIKTIISYTVRSWG